MAKKRTRSAREPSEPDDFKGVVAALKSLRPPIKLTKVQWADPDALADALLDAKERIDPLRLQLLLRSVQVRELADLARSILVRECLLLDAVAIAELSVHRILDLVRRKKRAKPFRSFARIAVNAIVESARGDATLAPPRNLGTSNEQTAFIEKLAHRVNLLGFPARRVVYLALVERTGLEEIVRRTNAPLEHVEWVLETVLGSARAFLAFEATRDEAIEEPPANSADDDEDDDGDDWMEASYGP
jgi:hypothetical protein